MFIWVFIGPNNMYNRLKKSFRSIIQEAHIIINGHKRGTEIQY